MKKIRLFSLLTLFILAASSVFIFARKPANEATETVIVRARYGNVNVFYGGGNMRGYPYDTRYTIGFDTTVTNVIQSLNHEGYKVISASNSDHGNDNDELWVLTKK